MADQLSEKKTAVLAVGASHFDQELTEEIRKFNFERFPGKLDVYYGRGIFNEGIMRAKDRFLCGMIRKIAAGKHSAELKPWMRDLFGSKERNFDWTERSSLKPLLEDLKRLE